MPLPTPKIIGWISPGIFIRGYRLTQKLVEMDKWTDKGGQSHFG